MNKTFAALAVSIALVSIGVAAPATAADMSGNGAHGSIKDRGPAGIPVPAPAPYEENYRYYLGLGAGWTFMQSGDVGLTAGGYNGKLPFGGVDDFSHPYSFSIFAGRYITPSLRTELGLDVRSKRDRHLGMNYQAHLSGSRDFGGTVGVQTVTNTYDVTRSETVTTRDTTGMINVYYDMNRGGRLNPYVGAGIGINYMQLSRGTSEQHACAYGSPDPTALVTPPTTPCWGGTTPGLPGGSAMLNTSNATNGWGLAASLMAGMTYNISERMHWDMGYRLMYQGGKALVATSSLGPCNGCNSFSGVSVLNVGTRIDHELRTGIRWDLW